MAVSEVRVAHEDSIPLAVVRRLAKSVELARVVPEGCGVVWSFVRARQLRAGRNVALYWDGDIHLDVGVEMADVVPEGGEVIRSATPSGPVASVVHLGPYRELGAAHGAILDWCRAHGRRPAGPSWEIHGHWQDDWNADPSRIRTDVYYQLAPS